MALRLIFLQVAWSLSALDKKSPSDESLDHVVELRDRLIELVELAVDNSLELWSEESLQSKLSAEVSFVVGVLQASAEYCLYVTRYVESVRRAIHEDNVQILIEKSPQVMQDAQMKMDLHAKPGACWLLNVVELTGGGYVGQGIEVSDLLGYVVKVVNCLD